VLGDAPGPAGAPRLVARVSVSPREDGRWHVRIVTLGESGGERVFDSASCSALTNATALVLAIRLKPTLELGQRTKQGSPDPPTEVASTPAPPAPPTALPMPIATRPPAVDPYAPPLPPHAGPRARGSFLVGASVRASLGEFPSADASVELDVAYALGRFRIEVHGETGLVQAVSATTVDSTSNASATFQAAGGGLRGCYGPSFGGVSLFGCADGQVDAMWASGRNYFTPLSTDAVWATLGALVGARYPLTPRFALRGFVEALAPLSRPKFVTETSAGAVEGTVHVPSAVWGTAGLGVEAIFF